MLTDLLFHREKKASMIRQARSGPLGSPFLPVATVVPLKEIKSISEGDSLSCSLLLSPSPSLPSLPPFSLCVFLSSPRSACVAGQQTQPQPHLKHFSFLVPLKDLLSH